VFSSRGGVVPAFGVTCTPYVCTGTSYQPKSFDAPTLASSCSVPVPAPPTL